MGRLSFKEIKELIETHYDEIISKGLEAYEHSLDNGNFQGWQYWITINRNGEVSMHYASQGTMSMEEFHGEAYRICTFTCMPYDFTGDFGEWTDEIPDIADFKAWLKQEYNLNDEEVEEYMVFSNYADFNPVNYARICDMDREMYIEEHGERYVRDIVDDTLCIINHNIEYYGE